MINHCEDLNLSAGGDMHEGVQSTRLGLRGIPSASEDVMVARDMLLAELTGARYHVAHISTKHAVAMVKLRKVARSSVTLRGTPASLLAYAIARCSHTTQLQNEAAAALLLRRGRGRSKALPTGRSTRIATDHAPHPGSEKMQEFEKCPFGILGLETAIGLTL